MFYERQPEEDREQYKRMLMMVGQLSNLYSDSECPYLFYRMHENIFCKYLKAINLARFDCSADAKKDKVGIGLKTWVGNNDQKVAEFGKLKKNYAGLTGLDLVKKIAEYRNERIRVTMRIHGIDTMIYHVVKRIPHTMQILECSFDYIDIENIHLIEERGRDNNTYFTDGKHVYHFSVSKNTLYMIFDDLKLLDAFNVEIVADPFAFLMSFAALNVEETKKIGYFTSQSLVEISSNALKNNKRQLCLPLYSRRGKEKQKFVAQKSGLNQWNAGGRSRNTNELYIPYLTEDRQREPDFFPPRDTPFTLHLPDGTEMSAKVCQEADKNDPLIGKAIMSNPNKILGKWLLRDVFGVEEGTLITYEMLEKFGVDSVVFTKNSERDYSIEFTEIGTYENFYKIESEEE